MNTAEKRVEKKGVHATKYVSDCIFLRFQAISWNFQAGFTTTLDTTALTSIGSKPNGKNTTLCHGHLDEAIPLRSAITALHNHCRAIHSHDVLWCIVVVMTLFTSLLSSLRCSLFILKIRQAEFRLQNFLWQVGLNLKLWLELELDFNLKLEQHQTIG